MSSVNIRQVGGLTLHLPHQKCLQNKETDRKTIAEVMMRTERGNDEEGGHQYGKIVDRPSR
jgi:hypothetical protein